MHHELQTDNLFESFTGVWKRVITEPRRFFEEMPVSGGLQNPLVFLLVCLAISAVGFLVIGPRALALLIIVLGVVRAFIGALVVMVVAQQVFRGTGDYEATFRALAYSGAPVALLWIPLIRPLVALYLLFLVVLGIERVHGFDVGKAVLTLLLSFVAIGTVVWTLGLAHLWIPASMMPMLPMMPMGPHCT
ncbi:MAG: YIP1 family protein [Deltaproteobacteria bacterium]|nr:YIP1 family protein [Deltaproteobacteria bacterium]